MDNLQLNLSRLLRDKGWSQADLADKADVEPATVNRVLKGTVKLMSQTAPKLAKALEVPVSDLFVEPGSHKVVSIGQRRIPVWDYTTAAPFVYSSPHGREDAEGQQYVLTDKDYSPRTFALLVTDDSMAPRFPKGMVAIIDPERDARPNSTVAVGYKDKGKSLVVLRKYHDRGQNAEGDHLYEAVPEQPAFRTLRPEDADVLFAGVMVEERRYSEHF